MDLCFGTFLLLILFGSFPLKDYFAGEIDTDELITNYSRPECNKMEFLLLKE